ncbi:MAG: adenylate/guanylate cyclase domain-containing protein [Campylobacterota bacterium]|nr:adenylate/guanylate cyclase domain-containing protein [Campylobacterota bacterium]
MLCSSCKFENNDESNFCTRCGNPLVRVCPVCHYRAAEDDLYCGICGTHLILSDLKVIPAKRSSMVSRKVEQLESNIQASSKNKNSERKTVTVLFADISGFTAMSEKLDPEEVTIIMNKCLSMMGDSVTKYEGYIDKYIGDCIMAIFGAPVTHENDPELALLAAIDMNKKIKEFNKDLPIKLEKPLTLHTGINTGLVVAGNMGSDARMDYTVMGDTVNLASRLESKAVNGQIFISAYTYHQTKNLFEFIKHEPVQVKGKKDPVDVYEVVRVLDDSEIKTSTTSQIPIVGREKEMQILSSCAQRLYDGEGQAIFLVSDPGFGKSRVQIELKKRFGKGDIQFIEGRSHSFSKNTPYHIFIDMFKRLCGIDADDLEETKLDKFVDNLPLLLGEDRDFLTYETKKSLVLIGRLLNLDLSDKFEVSIKDMSLQEINTATIRSISTVFEKFGKNKPVVLSLEDLHYADTPSIEIINAIISAASRTPILILCIFRPEKNTPSSKLIPYARRVLGDKALEITFDRLTRDDCESMVKYILGSKELPKELLDLVGIRSDGNPLFLQEILHSLRENGAIEITKEGTVKLLKELSSVMIPSSITGLIISRFDQFSSELRDFLSLASVVGATFSKNMMINFVSEDKLNEYIDILMDADMIFESSSFPDIKYSFHTSYIQEAVYSTLLLKRRQTLHKQVAQMILKLNETNPEEYVESLAYHFYEAADFINAYKYHVQSAYKSKNIFANELAARFFKKAIEISSNIEKPEPNISELNKSYSQVLELLGDMDGAIKALEDVISNQTRLLPKADAMRNIGRIEEKRGYKETAVKIYEDALKLIKNKTESLEYGMLLMNISWVLNRFRKVDEAIEKSSEALGLFEKLSSLENIALCCNNLAVFYENKGDFDTALDYNNRSLELFKKISNRRQIGNVELSLGYLYNKRGELQMALEHFTLSAKAMDMIGNSVGIATALLAKGRCYEDMKRYDEAEISLLSALRKYRELHMDRRVVATDVSLINVLLDKKDIVDAYKHIEEAMIVAKEHDFQSDIGKLNRLWARTLRYEGKEEESHNKYEEAYNKFIELHRDKDAVSVKKEMGE